jgi:NAD(P)-dependent dehydrogenase (short-subunit alcohol dehydrogenase family)
VSLSGKTVVVTGAAGSLGKAVVRAAVAAGARVEALDRSEEALAAVAGPGVTVRRVDLLDADGLAALLRDVAADGLAAIAGGFTMGTAAHEASDDWDAMQRINVTTLRNTLAAVVPGMLARGAGSVVTIGSRNGLSGPGAMSAYAAAKGAVHRITESLAAEGAPRGVRANCVLPSIIDTPANRAAMPGADASVWVSPDDLAALVVFLLSDASRAVQGALIPAYGRA